MSSDSYAEYADWKNWSGFQAPSLELVRYFEKEMTQAGVPFPGNLLEVGFGRGEFLAWAGEKGCQVAGVELIPELVEGVTEHGLRACVANLAESVPSEVQSWGPFDAIVALDVMEHLNPDESMQLLRNLHGHANPECRLVLRFPNGESPFSARVQNGDHTHRQWLTRSKLEQYCVGTGWQVVDYRNAARIYTYRGMKGLLKRSIHPLRNLVEILLGSLYWSGRVPLDPVATAVLVRDA